MPAPYTSFLNVPVGYTPSPNAFRTVLEKAGKEIVRIAVIGDSQETQYGGYGDPYIPALNQQFALRYGNAPASTIGGGNYGGYGTVNTQSDKCKWLKTNREALSASAAAYPTAKILPNITVSGVNTNANYQSGKLIALNDKMSAAYNINHRYTNFFDASQGVYQEIYFGSRPEGGPICLGSAYNANWSHSFTLADAVQNIDPGLRTDAPQLVKYTTPLLTGPTSAQYLYTGQRLQSGTTNRVDIVDARFITANPAKRYGVVVDNFGFGGYTAQAWYDAFKGTGEMLKFLGPYDMIVFHFGANDSIGTVAAHESALRLLISYARDAHNDQTLPIVICSDGYRQHSSSPIRTVYQTFPGVGLSLAQEIDNVMVINLQRMTDHLGINDTTELETTYTDRGAWTNATAYSVNDRVAVTPFATVPGYKYQFYCREAHTSDSTTNGPGMDRWWVPLKRYLVDGVHLNANGGDVAAQCFVNALYQAAFLPANIQPGLPGIRRSH